MDEWKKAKTPEELFRAAALGAMQGPIGDDAKETIIMALKRCGHKDILSERDELIILTAFMLGYQHAFDVSHDRH